VTRRRSLSPQWSRGRWTGGGRPTGDFDKTLDAVRVGGASGFLLDSKLVGAIDSEGRLVSLRGLLVSGDPSEDWERRGPALVRPPALAGSHRFRRERRPGGIPSVCKGFEETL